MEFETLCYGSVRQACAAPSLYLYTYLAVDTQALVDFIHEGQCLNSKTCHQRQYNADIYILNSM